MTKRTYSIEAPDQQRLKVARAEIEAVLKKHDLAGYVVLHTPGMVERFYDINPSYSCVSLNEATQELRVRSKLADYPSREAQLHDQAASANMAKAIAIELHVAALMFKGISMVVDRAAKAEHGPGVFRPDPLEQKRH